MGVAERKAARRLGVLVGLLIAMVIIGSLALSLAEGVSAAYGFVPTMNIITTLGTIGQPQPGPSGGRRGRRDPVHRGAARRGRHPASGSFRPVGWGEIAS